jgi:hypothetical protein
MTAATTRNLDVLSCDQVLRAARPALLTVAFVIREVVLAGYGVKASVERLTQHGN